MTAYVSRLIRKLRIAEARRDRIGAMGLRAQIRAATA